MLFFAAMSAIALTSCVNEDSNYEQPQQAQVMRFDAPAMLKTRAKVKGEITGVHYNVEEEFTVFCKYYKGNFTNWESAENYFNAAGETAKNEGSGSQYWSTQNTYYWPEIDYNLAFAAYSPAELTTAPTSIAHTNDGLQIVGFQTEDNADAQYDLMYSNRLVDRNKANNGSSAVNLVFNHALSSIVFSSEKEDENVNYVITDLKLHGTFVNKANFNQNLAGEKAIWSEPAAKELEFAPFFNDVNVTTVPTQFTQKESALLLIPQEVPAEAAVTIVYNKITTDADGNTTTLENTATIKLADFAKEDGNKITAWEMGNRYVYRIAFGQNKRIYFEPTTTDWVQEPTLIYTIQ